MSSSEISVDLAVIGGGVNGAGIARDASGRGLTVLLCEQHDLAQHTSSASTKLIHGGLRYLEYYEFRLVRKALQEREILLSSAPHIMHPMRFVMPHDPTMRPVWMIRLGLFLYDHLARRKLLPASNAITLSKHPAGVALREGFRDGFEYSDGWVDDARLVALCAVEANERGARIMTRTQCVGAARSSQGWQLTLHSATDGTSTLVNARAVVNAAGPWVARVLKGELGTASKHAIRLVKGSHIVVRKLFDHPFAYIFQNPDGRIIFAIPYEEDFTLIGTTDIDHQESASRVTISNEEIDYLCAMANRYFRTQIGPRDVVHTYSGVRPLLEDDASDASSVTRDYWLELNTDAAPVLSVFGGKITTFRRLAEEAMDLLLPAINAPHEIRRHWTAAAFIPGGDLGGLSQTEFVAVFVSQFPWLPENVARRYVRSYGSRVFRILAGAESIADMGEEVAPGLFERELNYLCTSEWVMSGEDVLWRRTKLGLHYTQAQRERVDRWITGHLSKAESVPGGA